MLVRRYLAGENVTKICTDSHISRTLFYRLLKRYQLAGDQDQNKALKSLRPKGVKHWRYNPEVENLVLREVINKPELSVHKISQKVNEQAGKRVVSSFGVYNILKRHNLNTYEYRLRFANQTIEAKALPRAEQPATMTDSAYRSQSISTIPPPNKISQFTRVSLAQATLGIFSGLLVGIVGFGFYSLIILIIHGPTLAHSIGIFLASISLIIGLFFLIYSLKYYFTIAVILSYSRQLIDSEKPNNLETNISNYYNKGVGLIPDLSAIDLSRKPFISIHLATYNETKVIDRLLTAATSMEYENYEVILADDSTDETLEILKKWTNHPRVKIVHRPNREGYKGGALGYALKQTNPKAEFVIIFDADFIPYPDTIIQFLKYFQSVAGGLDPKQIHQTNIAAIQGYQWHVLNKSENWITRGVRSEYAGSYVIERSGIEIYSGLKQIAGSVYMIRADVLKKIGWGRSITEDFELTLKMYQAGYKVVFTPYIQAPAEAVSTIKRLIRQRMRWAEGHSHNIRKMFWQLVKSSNLTVPEKLEFAYLSPYYLQSFFFIVGTLSWFLAEVVFQAGLPFWTAIWGWSLVFTNLLALPLMNIVGLFLEESNEKDYLGIFSFVVLSYVVAPFQGYAAVKGFLEKEEGTWFRTPKTGRITDIYTKGRFYRYIFGIFGKSVFSKGNLKASQTLSYANQLATNQLPAGNTYVNLKTSANSFSSFTIKKSKKFWWIGKVALSTLLIVSTTLLYLSRNVKLVYATNWSSPLKLDTGAGEGTFPSFGNYLSNSTTYGAGDIYVGRRNQFNSGTNNYVWYTNLWPTGTINANIPGGNYYIQLVKSGNSATTNTANLFMQLLLSNNDGTDRAQLLSNSFQLATTNADNTVFQFLLGNAAGNNIVSTAQNRLSYRFGLSNGFSTSNTPFINFLINNSGAESTLITPANITVPEIPKKVIFFAMIIILPIAPALVSGRFRRPKRGIFEEASLAWLDLIRRLTG
ncbi:glycosyltransferase, partial [Candidatus Daviesbacteria bacterium]|nr:glycosyltransferase [Candidatus Daviesbacteria bacterium]